MRLFFWNPYFLSEEIWNPDHASTRMESAYILGLETSVLYAHREEYTGDSINTSDSDVSHHTSTVVENRILQNGRTNGDITLEILPDNQRRSSGI